MFGFLQLIALYTIIETVILLCMVSKIRIYIGSKAQEVKRFINPYLFAMGLIIYIVPHVYMLTTNKFSYPNPDTYGNVIGIEKDLPSLSFHKR